MYVFSSPSVHVSPCVLKSKAVPTILPLKIVFIFKKMTNSVKVKNDDKCLFYKPLIFVTIIDNISIATNILISSSLFPLLHMYFSFSFWG